MASFEIALSENERPCHLGGVLLPGVVRVNIKKTREVERNKPKGSGGSRMKDNGYLGAEVSIAVTIWSGLQRQEWYRDVLPLIDPKTPDGPKTPLVVDHHRTALHGIETLYVHDIDDPDEDEQGKQTITLSCFEWLPGPKPVKSAPGAKPPAQEQPKTGSDGSQGNAADEGAVETGDDGEGFFDALEDLLS